MKTRLFLKVFFRAYPKIFIKIIFLLSKRAFRWVVLSYDDFYFTNYAGLFCFKRAGETTKIN